MILPRGITKEMWSTARTRPKSLTRFSTSSTVSAANAWRASVSAPAPVRCAARVFKGVMSSIVHRPKQCVPAGEAGPNPHETPRTRGPVSLGAQTKGRGCHRGRTKLSGGAEGYGSVMPGRVTGPAHKRVIILVTSSDLWNFSLHILAFAGVLCQQPTCLCVSRQGRARSNGKCSVERSAGVRPVGPEGGEHATGGKARIGHGRRHGHRACHG